MSRVLLLASEKPQYRDLKFYGGAHSRLLDRMLGQAGLSRSDVDVEWAGGEAAWWSREKLAAYKCIVAAGDFAATEMLGWNCKVSNFHGSILPLNAAAPVSYEAYRSWLKEPPKVVITWDIIALHHNWEWHPQAYRDWQRVGQICRGMYVAPDPDSREWIVETPGRLGELLSEPAFAFDTELSDVWNIAFANRTQVHAGTYSCGYQAIAPDILRSPDVIKVAHNLQHDLGMCDVRWGFQVLPPYFDTYGGATSLNTALERSLSPGISSRYTNWPYHKWLVDVDALHYNGIDAIVCFDAYEEIVRQLKDRGLWDVSLHDHQLLEALYEMQRVGFRIDEAQRYKYALEMAEELAYAEDELVTMAEPIIRSRLKAFEKPHLFREMRQCKCCGGGKVSAQHCWRCGGLSQKPEKKLDYDTYGTYVQVAQRLATGQKYTVAQLRDALPMCKVCEGAGKVERWNRFNPDSSSQVADVVYRGLRIAPRRNKGEVTVAADKLKPLAGKYPLIAKLVEASVFRADLDTVARLTPDPMTGRVHCVFDPWGTESGRVASSEGLLRKGTNAMNIPKKARRFVVPG